MLSSHRKIPTWVPVHRLVLAFLLTASFAGLSAQDTLTPVTPSVAEPAVTAGAGTGSDSSRIVPLTIEPAALAVERAKDFDNSLALFKARDLVNAEKVLLRSNRWQSGTLGWQLESAGRLTHMALVLRQRYDYPGSLAVAQRALAILRDADGLALKASASKRSAVHEQAAYIAEEILRDPVAARTEYQLALQFNAKSVRAREGVQRLDEAQAKVTRLGTKS
jgi:hypothetical protein